MKLIATKMEPTQAQKHQQILTIYNTYIFYNNYNFNLFIHILSLCSSVSCDPHRKSLEYQDKTS